MTLQKRERWALVALAGAAVLALVLRSILDVPVAVVAAEDSVPAAQLRLARARQRAATLPEREQTLNSLSAELARREQGMIQADTSAQAQAQLLGIARRIAAAQNPPLDLRTAEVGQVKPLGAEYGEVSIPLLAQCRIEQLLNFLADLTAQPELLGTGDLRVWTANAKDKTLNVRLTLSGVTPRRLVPLVRGPGLL
jgi:hypothetical protein